MFLLLLSCQNNKADFLNPSDTGHEVVSFNLHESGPITCSSPVDRTVSPFLLTSTEDLGTSSVSDDKWDHSGIQNWIGAEGGMVSDFNNDGRPDIYIPTMSEDILLMQAADFTFTNESASRISGDVSGISIGGIATDIDGDLDQDILLLGFLSPFQILINDGAGYFTSLSFENEIQSTVYSPAIAVGDPDGDQDLDFVVASIGLIPEDGIPFEGAPSLFFKNDGGQFTVTELANNGPAPQSFFAAFLDLDNDTDQDLYVVNDHGVEVQPSQIYQSFPGGESLFELLENTTLNFAGDGMGLGVGDLNKDGFVDLLVTDYGLNHLFLSDGLLSWHDAAQTRMLNPIDGVQTVAWGAQMIDINHDGLLDIWISYGQSLFERADPIIVDELDYRFQPDSVFIQLEDGTFTDMASIWGMDRMAVSRGGIWTDIDRNGFLDFLSIAQDEPPELYMATCDDSNWLNVKLIQPNLNTDAIGSKIEVETGGEKQTHWVLAGGVSYSSSGLHELHFGMSDHQTASISVTWPDGKKSKIDSIQSNQFITITRE